MNELNIAQKRYHEPMADERIGETVTQKCGEVAFIVEYRSKKDITIQFVTTGELVKSRYRDFKKGNIKSHFTPSVFGVGILGLEKTIDENKKQLPSHRCWVNMLQRCYSAKCHEKQPSYIGCSVSNDWLYYENFKKWYDANYYEIDGETSQCDKDILHKGNKVYSAENCVFVPQLINKLFTKNDTSRSELPIGVRVLNKRYQARCGNNSGKSQILGCFDTPIEAFKAYKTAKEVFIKEVANEYKNRIPSNLYDAMMRYQVSIED